MKKILANKVYSDATLKKWEKEDLIEQIRILEHNWATAEEALNNSAKNSEKIISEQKAEIARLEDEKYKIEQNLKQCENGYELELHTARHMVAELKSKETPKKVKCCIKLPKDRIAGYCPNCDGTVDIELTGLIKIKGHRCSWCGQAIDLTGVEVE